ncbi:MAG: hypothetical protein NZ533_09590 [Casimicrobiaceae bacterium]|nr:hypothetical protein [Casimicrobiaceae bacterium]
MRGLRDLPAWASQGLTTIAQVGITLLAAIGVYAAFVRRHRDGFLIAVATLAGLVLATSWIDVWGFWYFDAYWPSIAVLAAFGIHQISERGRAFATVLLVFPATVLLLAIFIKTSVVVQERYRVMPHALFFPAPASEAPISVPTARALDRYRHFVRTTTQCFAHRLTGLDEFWLRDLTLRWHLYACPRTLETHTFDGHGLPRFLLLTRDQNPLAMARLAAPVFEFAGSSVHPLPVAGHVRFNEAPFVPRQGWQKGTSYSYYAPLGIAAGSVLEASREASGRSAPERLHVLLRCLDTTEQELFAALEDSARLERIATRRLGPLRYDEFTLALGAEGKAHVRFLTSLRCDLDAFVL